MHIVKENEGDTMFMILITQEEPANETWYLDSGCSNHMTCIKDLFIKIDETLQKEVRTGDNKKLTVTGKGNINVQTKDGSKRIQDEYFVPGLMYNLLSVGQLIQKGYDLHFKNTTCIIKDPTGNVLGKITMRSNRMFPVNFKEEGLFSLTLSTKNMSLLWHDRFGHVNFGYLNYTYKHNMVKGMPNIGKINDICEGCMKGKQSREAFPQDKAWRATRLLELVHTDVCGPMKTQTIGGNRYLLTFIDDFSRKLWVYFLKENMKCSTRSRHLKHWLKTKVNTR